MSNKSAYNSEKSRIKMVILMPPGHKNQTWYNFIKHNNRTNENIIAGMKRRFMQKPIAQFAQVLQFYDVASGNLIEQHNS